MAHVTTDRDEQIDQLIAEYVLAEQNGKAPRRETWLAAHPSFAGELAEFLDDRVLFASAVRPIRAAITPGTMSGDDLPTIGLNASSVDTDVPLEPATIIGDYRLIAEIARGGMGVVYKAHHERLNRTVALKMVLPGRLGSTEDIERFFAEARAAAKLADPHIVPIYEIGEYRGRPFFSMQFVPGGSLREHLGQFRTDPRATAKLIELAAIAEQKLQLVTKDLQRAKDESDAAQKAAADATQQRDAAIVQTKQAAESARRMLYAIDMQLAHAALQTENLSTAIEVLERQKPKVGESDLRGFEWNYVWRLTHGERLNLAMAKEKQQVQPLTGLDVTLDGSTLAAADMNGTIKVWDLQTGALLKTLVLDTGDKPAVPAQPKFDDDPVGWAKTFFVGGKTKIVGVSFTGDGKSLRVTLRKDIGQDFMMKRVVPAFMNKELPSLAMVADQLEVRQIALDGMSEPTLEPFDPARLAAPLSPLVAGSCFLANSGEMMTIGSMVLSPNGKLLAMGGIAVDPRPGQGPGMALKGGVVVVWNLETKTIIATYRVQGVAAGLAFSPDSATLAVGGIGGSVHLHSPGKEGPSREFTSNGMQAMSVAFSSDGSRLASGEMGGNVRLWDVASGKEQAVLRGQFGNVIRLAFAQGDAALVCGGASIKVWDLGHLPGQIVVRGHFGAVKSLAFSADGKQLHAADTTGKSGTYDSATGERLGGNKTTVLVPSAVAISPRGAWYAASAKDGLLLQNTKTGAEQKLEVLGQTIFTIAFSADEQFVSAGAITGELTVWKIEGWEKLPPVSGKGGFAFAQQFSPHGGQLAFGKEGLVQIYDFATKTQFAPWPEKFPGMLTSIAFSQDGSLLAAGSAGTVRIYDLDNKRERLRIAGVGPESMAVTLSPDNRRLAMVSHSGSLQATARLFELETGREVLSLPMPRGTCTALAFSPDGRRIATATTPTIDPLSFAQPDKKPAEIQIWEAP